MNNPSFISFQMGFFDDVKKGWNKTTKKIAEPFSNKNVRKFNQSVKSTANAINKEVKKDAIVVQKTIKTSANKVAEGAKKAATETVNGLKKAGKEIEQGVNQGVKELGKFGDGLMNSPGPDDLPPDGNGSLGMLPYIVIGGGAIALILVIKSGLL